MLIQEQVQTPTPPADTVGGDSASTADSTLAAVRDSTADAITTLGQEVSNAGRLLADGEWDTLGQRMLNGAVETLGEFTPRLVSAIFVALVFWVVYRTILGGVRSFLRRSKRVDPGLEALALRTFRAVGLTFVAVIALSQLGVNVSALLAGLGIAGLALGFAAKDSLENFLSGLSILLDRPFRVGHWVEVDGTYGQVTGLTLRSTRIRTLNREEVVIPNKDMINQALTNKSSVGSLRVDIEFGVAYKEDLDETREVIMGLVEGDERLSTEQAPRVVVTKLNDSSVDLELHLFLKDPAQAVAMRFEYTEKVRKALARAGIEIPFPHLQLFVDGAKGLAELPLFSRGLGDGGGSPERDEHGHPPDALEDARDEHGHDEGQPDPTDDTSPAETEPAGT